MNLTLLPDTFAIVRMSPDEQWKGEFFSITKTPEETSVVCREQLVRAGMHADRGWQCLKIDGPLPLKTVGVMADVSTTLARAGVSIFPIATYATDYIFIKGDKVAAASDALRSAGHTVRRA